MGGGLEKIITDFLFLETLNLNGHNFFNYLNDFDSLNVCLMPESC